MKKKIGTSINHELYLLDRDERGICTARDTKIARIKYVLIENDILQEKHQVLADYLESQLRKNLIKDNSHEIDDFIAHLRGHKSIAHLFPVAERGDDACISFGDVVLFFKNSTAAKVREYTGDKTEYTHSFAIKTAHYHTYNEVKCLSDENKVSYFGVSVKPRGSINGKIYLRNDDYYDRKYFRGADYYSEDYQNPHFNKGSTETKFFITKKQAELLRIKLMHDYYDMQNRFVPYNFLGDSTKGILGWIIGRGKNCVSYSHELYEYIGLKGSFLNYQKIDELDDRDQGIFHQIFAFHGRDYITFNAQDVFDHFAFWNYKEPYSKVVHDKILWLSSISSSLYCSFQDCGNNLVHLAAYNGDINFLETNIYKSTSMWVKDKFKGVYQHLWHSEADSDNDNASPVFTLEDHQAQNYFGQTPLHIAIAHGKFSFASKMIDKGIDVDIQDYRGDTAVVYVAAQYPSNEKLALLEKILKASKNPNIVDFIGEGNALTAAINANDPDAVELLIKYGADPSFVTSVGDNLMHIAVRGKKYDVIKVLHKYDDQLIFKWNEEEEIPIVAIKKLDNAHEILDDVDDLYDPSYVVDSEIMNHEDLYFDFI